MHPAQDTKIDRMRLSLLIILAGSFIAPLLVHSSILAIPVIAQELDMSAEQVSLFTMLNVLGSVCLVLPAGKMADKWGRRRIFNAGILVSGLASVAGGISSEAWLIVASRAFQGMGGALIFASAVALLMSVPPAKDQTRYTGIYISVAYLGMVLGPIFGGLVIDHMHWRMVFILPGIILLALSAIGMFSLKWERYGDRQSRLRLLDISVYWLAMVVLAFGVFDASDVQGQMQVLLGLSLFAAFWWFQTKRQDPLLEVTLFTKHTTYCILGVSHFLTYVSIFGLPFIASLYLQYVKGMAPQTTAWVLLIQAFCTALIAWRAGSLSQRFRARYLIFFGLGLLVVASSILVLIDQSSPVWMLVLPLALIGFAIGAMDAPLLQVSLRSVPEKLLGTASATMNGLRSMGGFASMGVISFLMGRHLGDTEIIPDTYPSLMLAIQDYLLVAATVSVLCLLLVVSGVLRLDRREKQA